jgi:hypothetical protein
MTVTPGPTIRTASRVDFESVPGFREACPASTTVMRRAT